MYLDFNRVEVIPFLHTCGTESFFWSNLNAFLHLYGQPITNFQHLDVSLSQLIMTGNKWTPESVTVGHSVSWGTFVFGFPTALKLMLTKCIGFCDIHATERATSRGN